MEKTINTMNVTLFNDTGCELGSYEQNFISDDMTNALIECLMKNHIVLCDGDTLKIEYK
jgi:hypothetical protein